MRSAVLIISVIVMLQALAGAWAADLGPVTPMPRIQASPGLTGRRAISNIGTLSTFPQSSPPAAEVSTIPRPSRLAERAHGIHGFPRVELSVELSLEEALNFDFYRFLNRTAINRRLVQTPIHVLKILATRAKFVMRYEHNPLALHNAVMIVNLCLKLGVAVPDGPLSDPIPTPSPVPTPTALPGPVPAPTAPPDPQPSPVPTAPPGPQPSPVPTEPPGPQPSPVPTEPPSPQPSPVPTEPPGPQPSPVPTEPPSPQPSPTAEPTTPPSGTLRINDFFPTDPSFLWDFKDRKTGESFTFQITGIEHSNGVPCHKMLCTRADGTPEYDLISLDKEGLRLHVRQTRGINVPLSPPVVFSDAIVHIGKTHVTVPEIANPATGNRTKWTVKALRMETVTVPAGTFSPCIHFNLNIRDKGHGSQLANIDMWYAKGYGLVKRQGQLFGVFLLEELIRHNLPGPRMGSPTRGSSE